MASVPPTNSTPSPDPSYSAEQDDYIRRSNALAAKNNQGPAAPETSPAPYQSGDPEGSAKMSEGDMQKRFTSQPLDDGEAFVASLRARGLVIADGPPSPEQIKIDQEVFGIRRSSNPSFPDDE